MSGADVFLSQLRTGERVLWNAPGSAAVRDAWHRRSQRRNLLRAAGSVIVGAFCVWIAFERGRAWLAQPADIPSAFSAALLLALAALMMFCCVMLVRLYRQASTMHRITSTRHSHYVLTDQRLFYVDQEGELVDEIARHEVVAVELDEETNPPAILVERRTAEEEDKHLLLLNLEQPHVAKAKIAETFLEPAS
jgi:hypothetical protein